MDADGWTSSTTNNCKITPLVLILGFLIADLARFLKEIAIVAVETCDEVFLEFMALEQ